MAIDAHLNHRCDIQRAETMQDDYNTDILTWKTHLADVVCRLVIKEERVQRTDEAERAVITTYALMMRAGTDIKHGDQIVNLVIDGVATPGVYRIDHIKPRRAKSQRHITCTVEYFHDRR
ncbi:phage head completion protein [Herpetosiphon llansteffanensis]|uniref:phage head completion protein n=1 Tax=Herpetosiphon llansteffanensis TaxID=2094568 RepID=UPI000D7D054C|nr:head-tail adaptor protein [Herpetosiphon llansteffanensis]